MDQHAVLQWHIDMGCDECIADEPINRFETSAQAAAAAAARLPKDSSPPSAAMDRPSERPSGSSTAAMPATTRGTKTSAAEIDSQLQISNAQHAAENAKTIDELRAAIEAFEGCALKKTATNLVLCDGPADAKLMLVGEAPGAEEDRQGLPFVGPSGQLLNAMLESIGIDRADAMISNSVFWRPPGNRTPTTQETIVCRPFIERLIEIVHPQVLVCVGAPSAHNLLGETQGISRLRGKWYTYQTPKIAAPINATALFHPAYLLRTPIKKRDAWQDLLMIRRKLVGD
jgi:uracil-DNA glycosylase family 4